MIFATLLALCVPAPVATAAAVPFAAWATAQEPVPEADPKAVPKSDQEPEQGWDRQEAMQAISEAIEKVRLGFTDVDRVLTEARDQAEKSTLEVPQPIHDSLQAAANHAAELIGEMEHLLSLLPEDDSNNSKSSSNSNSSDSPENQPRDGRDPKEKGEPTQEPDRGRHPQPSEQQTGGELNPQQSVRPIFVLPGANGGWGNLPPRLQETLQNANAEDLPLRYRKQLEQFHGRQQRRGG